jgi:ketosteroid isomerase-like protein
MKIRSLLSFVTAILTSGLYASTPLSQPSHSNESAQTVIRSLLTDQQTAWNRGNVESFMKGYWNSPELTFAGSTGVVRGWQPVLARYRKNYPDAAAMGHLDFSDIEVRMLGTDAALVLGHWHLKRASDQPGGVFTLVFQHFPQGWRIIHDHTSTDPT